MEKVKGQKVNKKKVLDIVSYVGVFVFFVFALICVIVRFNGSDFYLFDTRFDVVLTDSMSSKNEEYLDFLEGHDDQIQRFDLVVSKKVKKPSDLKVYDVVVYKNRQIGTDMHRIVRLIDDGKDEITLTKVTKDYSLLDYKGFSFSEVSSCLDSNEICVKSIEVKTFTTIEDDGNHFNFHVLDEDFTPTIKQERVEGGFVNTYSIKRKSTTPGQIVIAHKNVYDYSKEVISSISIKSSSGDILLTNDTELTTVEDNLYGEFNPTYKYEIRGDKSNTSDGVYQFSEIYSKVTNVAPKLGYLFRFLGSIWGTIMFLTLGFAIIIYDIVANKVFKKQQASVVASNEAVNEEPNQEQKPEEVASETSNVESEEKKNE